MHSGTPLEWYALSENLYRACQLTGIAKYKEFGDIWRYDAYWNKFAATSAPADAHGVHAYSDCNSFSGAAMRYMLDGDPRPLQILKNFYDFLPVRRNGNIACISTRHCAISCGRRPAQHCSPWASGSY
jgi:uncharacterized protein